MSIEVVRKQVNEFLASETPAVIAISGSWGVGKTYSWKNEFLQDAKNEDRISMERYSYVSLFGINSLDSFKNAIFENIVNKNLIGTEPSVSTFKNNVSDIAEVVGRKSYNIFKSSPILKNFTNLFDSLAFLSLNKTLICIDDLERAGKDLKIQDVLGFVSLLKEQKKCKIVLLVNDNEEEMGAYKKYREKVVDIDLKFNPTSKDCASIVYKDNNETHKKLLELTPKLDIKNIRILKKIERLVNLGLPCLQGYEQEIRYNFIHSLILFTYCNYCENHTIHDNTDENVKNIVPTLKFVTNLGYSAWGIGKEKEVSEEHVAWKALLTEYGYQYTDEFDLVISDAIKVGYFVEDKLKHEANKLNEMTLASKSKSSFTETWSLFHNSFDDNQAEVINELYDSFKRNVKYIVPNNVNGTITLFKELGEKEKALELLEYYINCRKDETELFNIESQNFFGDIQDEDIIRQFQEVYSADITPESIKDILLRIASNNAWHSKDVTILANTSVDEYYNLFKSESGQNCIIAGLKFGQYLNPGVQEMEIANRAKEALLMIADESKINLLRIKKFGITTD